MSTQVNLVAFDGAATPVSHTLVPIGVREDPVEGTLAMWREGVTSLPTAAQVRCKTTQKRLKSGAYRVATVVEAPVMESISGQNAAGYTAAPKVAYTNQIAVVGIFSERSTIAERRLLRQLATNILGGIATTVTPVATGPVPELIDQFVNPS